MHELTKKQTNKKTVNPKLELTQNWNEQKTEISESWHGSLCFLLGVYCVPGISSGTSMCTSHNQPTDCPPLLESSPCLLGTGLHLWLNGLGNIVLTQVERAELLGYIPKS